MLLWIVGLFCAGMILILAEFFVPGAVLGILGALTLTASAAMGCYAYPDYAVFIIVGEFAGAVAVVLLGMSLLPKTGAGKRMILQESQLQEAGFTAVPSDLSLLGKEGTVLTALRPAGMILVDGRRIDAVSHATTIDAGERVRIIEVQGNRIVVEAVGRQ